MKNKGIVATQATQPTPQKVGQWLQGSPPAKNKGKTKAARTLFKGLKGEASLPAWTENEPQQHHAQPDKRSLIKTSGPAGH